MKQGTTQLAELVEWKLRVLWQLREMGRRQSEFVALRDTTSLLSLLSAKQVQIEQLQKIERDLSPYYAEDPEKRVWPSADARARCAAQAAECNALLQEIVGLEKLGVDQMTSHRNQLADQLQQLHAAADVRQAYEAQRR
jgi:hypothetical protein